MYSAGGSRINLFQALEQKTKAVFFGFLLEAVSDLGVNWFGLKKAVKQRYDIEPGAPDNKRYQTAVDNFCNPIPGLF